MLSLNIKYTKGLLYNYMKEYSYTNCKIECSILKNSDVYNCTPWYLPPGKFDNIWT